MQQAIAILDSGVGGLTVVKEVMRQLPQEKIIYFGDTARAPYGPRSPQEVRAFTSQIVHFLCGFHPKMIVIACNTATAVALNQIRNRVPIPVLGVIYPGARAAIKRTQSKRIGVIGTEGTIRSRAYDRALKRISPDIQVFSKSCSELVPLVEQGDCDSPRAEQIVREALEPLSRIPIDCLILGCTHYPFLEKPIAQVMGPSVQLISSAEETAREMSTILHERGQLAKTEKPPRHRFFCSGDTERFRNIAQKWLGTDIEVTQVVWDQVQIV